MPRPGFKFGLYTDRGAWTCGARPGSADHEHVDAQAFAEWGVDYLKVCATRAPAGVGLLDCGGAHGGFLGSYGGRRAEGS